jgi:hypothetical protein
MSTTNGTSSHSKAEAITEVAARHFKSDLATLLLGTLTSGLTTRLSAQLQVYQSDCVITYHLQVDPKPIGFHDPAPSSPT